MVRPAWIGGAQGLLFASDFPMERVDRHNLAARIVVRAGERVRLSIRYVEPELLDDQAAVAPEQHELDSRLDETLTWWEQWAREAQFDGPYVAGTIRSTIELGNATSWLTHTPRSGFRRPAKADRLRRATFPFPCF